MITTIGASAWTSEVITGNGEFIETSPGTFYVVSNSLIDGTFHIFKSTDYGDTFVSTATYTFPITGDVAFDPAICYDGTLIYIIGAMTNTTNTSLTDLVAFTLTPGSSDTLSSPTTIITGSRIHSGYDIISQTDGTKVVMVAVTNPVSPGYINDYVLLGIVLNSDNSVSSITPRLAAPWASSTVYALGDKVSNGGVNFICIIANTSTSTFATDWTIAKEWSVETLRSGETYGAISLVTDGTTVEAYYTAHLKAFSFGISVQQLRMVTFDGSSWSTETVIQSYFSNYNSLKLTVLPVSGGTYDRILTHLYYSQVGKLLFSILLIGVRESGIWNFATYDGTVAASFMEPTISVDLIGNIRLNYLYGNINLNQGGWLYTFLVDPVTLQFTRISGSTDRYPLMWMRGSKTPVDNSSTWAIIGETATPTISYIPVFISAYNLPPVVSLVIDSGLTTLSPPIETVKRGVITHLDATATFDPDSDPMEFSWASDDPTGKVELIPVAGFQNKIDVLIPDTVGAAEFVLNVTVSVVDLGADGTTPLHSPQTAMATLTAAATDPPSVGFDPSIYTYDGGTGQWAITAQRNCSMAILPTITDTDSNPLTYLWEQVSGPVLPILNNITSLYLWIRVSGASVLGDTAVFQLTVSDNINMPVSVLAAVNIPSIDTTSLDTTFLSRAVFSTTGMSSIGTRNDPTDQSSWGVVESGIISTNFTRMKPSHNALTGARRQTYIGSISVVTLGQEPAGSIFYRKIFPPGNYGSYIVDAICTESDQILVLTNTNQLLRYTSPGAYDISDMYQGSIDVSSYLEGLGTIMWFITTIAHNGSRVLAFATTNGALLIEINDSTFAVEADLVLSTANFNLYGGNNIVFIRFSEVESLQQGNVLIGSSTLASSVSSLEYFETLFDLNFRSVLSVWDRTNRISQEVVTGEFLAPVEPGYAGIPQAPYLTIIQNSPTSVTLSWTQIRQDLIEIYQIYNSVNPGIAVPPLSDAD